MAMYLQLCYHRLEMYYKVWILGWWVHIIMKARLISSNHYKHLINNWDIVLLYEATFKTCFWVSSCFWCCVHNVPEFIMRSRIWKMNVEKCLSALLNIFGVWIVKLMFNPDCSLLRSVCSLLLRHAIMCVYCLFHVCYILNSMKEKLLTLGLTLGFQIFIRCIRILKFDIHVFCNLFIGPSFECILLCEN